MQKQMELPFQLQRPFTPSMERISPSVWIEEFRVYSRFAPDAIQCKYTLRRGLNILWANPGPAKKKMYEPGVRGHAAGKSTFCRLLRYLLGEQNCGTRAFHDSLIGAMPNASLAAKVWVDGKPWIVCKPLGLDRRDLAFEGDNIDQLFGAVPHAIRTAEFSEMLGNLMTKPLTAKSLPYGAQLTWRYVLPWLSRDQECRLAHLLDWRDSSTDSNRPDMTIADACYIVRSVMGLITSDEETAQTNHRELLKTSKDLENKVPLLKHTAAQALARARQRAANPTLEGDLLFEDIKRTLQAKVADLGNDPELKDAKTQYMTLNTRHEAERDALMLAVQDYNEQRAALDLDLAEYRAYLGGARNDDARQAMDAEAPAPLGRCNVLLAVARLRGCSLAKGRTIDFESHKNLMTADQEAAALKVAIDAAEQALAAKKGYVGALRAKLTALEAERDAAEQAYDALRTDADQRRGVLIQQLTEVASDENAVAEAERKALEQEGIQRDLAESLRLQEEIRRRADEKRERVNGLFDDIIKAVLGNDVSASFKAHAQNLELTVECNGERTSAATETVKIIAFDQAAMLLSAEGFGHHPRFLIHDSPREADMANDIYQRFFEYMAELEKKYPGSEPNYQYIITTTEPPPKFLQQKPWLVAKLDASKAEGRVLRVNL